MKVLTAKVENNIFKVTVLAFGKQRSFEAPNLDKMIEKIFALHSFESKEQIMDDLLNVLEEPVEADSFD